MQTRVVPCEGNGGFLWWRNQLKMAFQCNYARFIQVGYTWHSFGSTALHNLFCPILIHKIIKLHHLDPQMGLHIPLFIATAHLQREVLRFFVQKAFEPLRHGSLSLWLHHWVTWGLLKIPQYPPSLSISTDPLMLFRNGEFRAPMLPEGQSQVTLEQPQLFSLVIWITWTITNSEEERFFEIRDFRNQLCLLTPSWGGFPTNPLATSGTKTFYYDPSGKTVSRMPPGLSENFGTPKIQLLVGGIPIPLKNIKVSWDNDIPNRWKVIIQSCSKPPSRLWFVIIFPFEIAITDLTWPGKVSSFRYQAWKKCMATRIFFSCSLENCWHSQHPIRTARGNPSPTSTNQRNQIASQKLRCTDKVSENQILNISTYQYNIVLRCTECLQPCNLTPDCDPTAWIPHSARMMSGFVWAVTCPGWHAGAYWKHDWPAGWKAAFPASNGERTTKSQWIRINPDNSSTNPNDP